jgi:hypothetical protein
MGSHPLHDLVVGVEVTDVGVVRWAMKPVMPELHEAAIALWVDPNDRRTQSAKPNRFGAKRGSDIHIAAPARHDYVGGQDVTSTRKVAATYPRNTHPNTNPPGLVSRLPWLLSIRIQATVE